ncbi:MAG: HD domain-containing protein [Nanoarchaeota archaeon]|nr:HD domain-containing protein [Nanoarchaeota archaeon]
MRIKDEIYGEEEINESYLVELINSPSIQRLKGISMGMPQEYYHKPIYSRYEHSVGVLVLLRKLKADSKEQIAGLLHDISHTAFSHVIDWVIGDPTKEDYQDNMFLDFIKNSEIPSILNKYNFNYKKFSNLSKFSLLEKDAPSLCADRFDYSIREINWNEGKDITEMIVKDLINHNNNMAFNSKKIAGIFAKGYSHCNSEHWAGDEAKARYYLLAKILKRALLKKIISINDLRTLQDYSIINLLVENKDKEILYHLHLLKDNFIIKKVESYEEGIILKKKFRYVDPEVLLDNTIVRLSDISQTYKTLLNKLKEESELDNKIIIGGVKVEL